MAEPKRHHWWPQLQSQHWTGADGLLHVTKADGITFTASPKNIGVESELYTRFGPAGEKDREIEKWFSHEVESPFADAFEEIISLKDLRKERYVPDPAHFETAKELGIRISPYREVVSISSTHREIIANYTAALLVRNPHYISKLRAFHSEENFLSEGAELTNITLHNILHLYDLYRSVIQDAAYFLVLADCEHEFLFSDAGITAEEPWARRSMPFDIHFPLTPKLALEIFPHPKDEFTYRTFVGRETNIGIAKQNRIALGSARRFVFSRGAPPVKFITKYFGVPAPKAYGHRYVNGKLETMYDRSRDK